MSGLVSTLCLYISLDTVILWKVPLSVWQTDLTGSWVIMVHEKMTELLVVGKWPGPRATLAQRQLSLCKSPVHDCSPWHKRHQIHRFLRWRVKDNLFLEDLFLKNRKRAMLYWDQEGRKMIKSHAMIRFSLTVKYQLSRWVSLRKFIAWNMLYSCAIWEALLTAATGWGLLQEMLTSLCFFLPSLSARQVPIDIGNNLREVQACTRLEVQPGTRKGQVKNEANGGFSYNKLEWKPTHVITDGALYLFRAHLTHC